MSNIENLNKNIDKEIAEKEYCFQIGVIKEKYRDLPSRFRNWEIRLDDMVFLAEWMKSGYGETDICKLFDKVDWKNVCMTITGAGNQIRLWSKQPHEVGINHCDSCGEGLLISLEADGRNRISSIHDNKLQRTVYELKELFDNHKNLDNNAVVYFNDNCTYEFKSYYDNWR